MSIRNNTVGTTEITPVETEVTKSMKQESRDFGRRRFKELERLPGYVVQLKPETITKIKNDTNA